MAQQALALGARHSAMQLARALGTRALGASGARTVWTTTNPLPPSAEALLGIDMGDYSVRQSVGKVSGRLHQQQRGAHEAALPCTLEEAMLQDSDQARIITTSSAPHTITHANGAWERLCGYRASEVVGRAGLGFLQGPGTDAEALDQIRTAVRTGSRLEVEVVNYKADGTPFVNHLRIVPLISRRGSAPGGSGGSGAARVTHLLGVLSEARPLPGGPEAARRAAEAMAAARRGGAAQPAAAKP